MKDKLVLFDWGGVVTNHENNLREYEEARYRVINHFNKDISFEEVNKRWINKSIDGKNIDSITDIEEFIKWFELLKSSIGFVSSFDDFKKAYEEEFSKISYYKDVANFANNLSSLCETGILSNLSILERNRISAQYDLSKFNYIFFSHEIGLVKPDKNIFLYVLNSVHKNPQDILLVDDDAKNIEVAKEMGFNTLKATGRELDFIKSEINKFLGL